MEVFQKKGSTAWWGKSKSGQEFPISRGYDGKYQKCVYAGDDFIIFEGKAEVTGDSTGLKKYTISKIENNMVKGVESFQGKIDSFEAVYGDKIAVRVWEGNNCYKQYYALNTGKKLDRDPFPIDTLEKKKKREREMERVQNDASSDTNSDNEENYTSNDEQDENNLADAISSGLIPRRSKIVAYLCCIFLGWFGAHHIYLATGKVFGKIDNKKKDLIPIQMLRALPYYIAYILFGVIAIKFNLEGGLEGDRILIVPALLLIIFIICIIDLITLGKQVNKVNEKIVKKFGF